MTTITDIKNKDPKLNEILKEMWRLDNKINNDEELFTKEQEFYNQNLDTIIEYYMKSGEYWSSRTKLQ